MLNNIFISVRKMLDAISIKNAYIPADKQRHFISGMCGGALLYPIIGSFSMAVISALAIGKEISDYFHRDVHTPDIFDWVATTSGGIMGTFIMYCLIG